MSELQLEAIKAGFTLGSHVLTAILLYFVARYITDRWNAQKKQLEMAMLQESQLAQKQRELQLLATDRFYQLYGEFCAVWRLWQLLQRNQDNGIATDKQRMTLLDRSCSFEGEMEAVFVRLATEYRLSSQEVAAVGRFRQASQSLRKAIRENCQLDWHAGHPKYIAFKNLACTVANLLANPHSLGVPTAKESTEALLKITDSQWDGNWADA